MLEWNVYRENINTKKIEVFNIFKHANFCFDLRNLFKTIKKEQSKYRKENELNGLITYGEAKAYDQYMEAFTDEALRRICLYNFWGKCEHEAVITSWPPYIERETINQLIEEDQKVIKECGKPNFRYNVDLRIAKKIDIYEQLRLNWDIFKQYILSHEKEIKKLK